MTLALIGLGIRQINVYDQSSGSGVTTFWEQQRIDKDSTQMFCIIIKVYKKFEKYQFDRCSILSTLIHLILF